MKKAASISLLLAVVLMFCSGCSNVRDTITSITNIESYAEIQTIEATSEVNEQIELESDVGSETVVEDPEVNSGTPIFDFAPVGRYDFAGFGEVYEQYTFDAPNDKWFVWGIGSECENYMIGCPETGKSYGDVIISGQSSFIALSSKYMLLATEKGIVAIDISDMSNKVPAYQLTEEERNDFVFPKKYEKVLNFHDHFIKEQTEEI